MAPGLAGEREDHPLKALREKSKAGQFPNPRLFFVAQSPIKRG